MIKKYLECGKIVSTHGLRGELKVQPWCDGPGFLCQFTTLYLERGSKPVTVESMRIQKNMALLKLEGVDTLDQAAAFRGKILYINRDAAPPSEDEEFFVQDIFGLLVRDADTGAEYGHITDVFFTGANDIYEITAPDGGKKLIPAIKQVVLRTDVEGGVMLIRPLEGLFC